MSAVQYCLLLLVLLLCDGCAIWQYLPEDQGAWEEPQGSEYFEVGLLTSAVVTDHNPLTYVQTPTVLSKKQERVRVPAHASQGCFVNYPFFE